MGTPFKSPTKRLSMNTVSLQELTKAAMERTFARGPSVAARSLESQG